VIAPDLRGHGDSDWSVGGNYTIADNLYDIQQLLRQKTDQPVSVISHSYGGAVSLLYTGLFPESVARLVVIEGTFQLQFSVQPVAERAIEWIEQLRNMSGRQPRRYPSIEAAYQRMQQENPHLTEERARHLTVHGVNQNEDGTYSWKFDNYTRAIAPNRFTPTEIAELWTHITSPTLLIYGVDSWVKPPQETGAEMHFKTAAVRMIERAGHWVHHDREDEVMALVRPFLETGIVPP
jgi:pimeloyl-ACP methyl ester carboxylesterase